jgi:hypothetical protein
LLSILVKEIMELVIRRIRIITNFIIRRESNFDVSSIISNIKKNGFHKEDDFFSAEECFYLRNKIDKFINQESTNVWIDDAGADHRIYFVNELDNDFEIFYKNPKIRQILAGYTGIINPMGMLLAARIDTKENNLGSGGGWHRDSPITHQFKAICYLSDVETCNGPFQYIEKSHLKISVLKAYLYRIFDFGKYRFTEEEVDNYCDFTKSDITEFTAKQGTIAYVDTKGIHRGKPIEKGSRYVLFCYFWSRKIPQHFENFKTITK